MIVCADVWRELLCRMTLWDVRTLVSILPELAEVASGLVCNIRESIKHVNCPRELTSLMRIKPCVQERVSGEYMLLRGVVTQHVYRSVGGAAVKLMIQSNTAIAKIEIHTVDPTQRPTFKTLRDTLLTLHWYESIVSASHPHFTVVFSLMSRTHNPMYETLHVLVLQCARILWPQHQFSGTGQSVMRT